MKYKGKIYAVKINSFVNINNKSVKPIKIQFKMSKTQIINYLFNLEQKRKEDCLWQLLN